MSCSPVLARRIAPVPPLYAAAGCGNVSAPGQLPESEGLGVAEHDGQHCHDEAQQGRVDYKQGGVETASLVEQVTVEVAVDGVDGDDPTQQGE
jgi:hypothetical protein